jgi:hypothetical protein
MLTFGQNLDSASAKGHHNIAVCGQNKTEISMASAD